MLPLLNYLREQSGECDAAESSVDSEDYVTQAPLQLDAASSPVPSLFLIAASTSATIRRPSAVRELADLPTP